MRGRSERPAATPLLDRAARAAAGGMTRRDLMRVGLGAAGAAVAVSLPRAAWPRLAFAQGSTGFCPSQPAGTCPQGMIEVPWRASAKVAVPSGRSATFNGCGAEGGLKLPFVGGVDPVPDMPSGADFSFGCVQHDCCYGKCGASKDACDDAFLADSIRACTEAYDSSWNPVTAGMRLNCIATAHFYRRGVSGSIGDDAFRSAQEDACVACERPRCPGGTEDCGDGACCEAGMCTGEGVCAHRCGGERCPPAQDCCPPRPGASIDEMVCCPPGTRCSISFSGAGRCVA